MIAGNPLLRVFAVLMLLATGCGQPTCPAPQVCASAIPVAPTDVGTCRQPCEADGGGCPMGTTCQQAASCCSTPGGCPGSILSVCCPPSGC